MTYYGSPSIRPRPLTVQCQPPITQPTTAFGLIATVPPGKFWKIQSISIENIHTTLKHTLHMALVPSGWALPVTVDILTLVRNLILEPGDKVTRDNVNIGMSPGAQLWAYQIETVGATGTLGIIVIFGGEESSG